MITFFTHCREFRGEFDSLQRTAISSWIGIGPDVQIILMGAPDAADVAKMMEIDHAVITGYNEHNTPLVNAIFDTGQANARHDIVCEISSDIVLSADSAIAIDAIRDVERPFVIGQRHDIEPATSLDEPPKPKLHPPSAVDYFIFRRGTLGEIPPYAVGRTAYDNWLVWAALHRWNMTVIDATADIYAVHVNHGYPEYGTKELMRQSEERKENLRLARETGCDVWAGVHHATHSMIAGQMVPK